MKKLFSFILVLTLLLVSSISFAVDRQVTLAWDHDGVDLAGFNIHYGSSTGSYITTVDVGMATLCSTLSITPEEYCTVLTIPVTDGAVSTLYFNASAYDAETPPNESGYAVEVSVIYDFELPPTITDLAASYDKPTSMLTFSWTYETAWLPKIEKWTLWSSTTQGTGYAKEVDIPYDPLVTPPYTTSVELTVAQEQITKYYVMVAQRGAANNNAFSTDSNEVTVMIDKMPPKSPFEFKVKIK
jgi:hypothetical protein